MCRKQCIRKCYGFVATQQFEAFQKSGFHRLDTHPFAVIVNRVAQGMSFVQFCDLSFLVQGTYSCGHSATFLKI